MANESILHVFISHSHKDNDFGERLVVDLRNELGQNTYIWYDTRGLSAGDDWWTKILKNLSTSSVFIVILSPDSMRSSWVKDEITIAWSYKNSPHKMLIIPILYRDCEIRDDLKILQIVSFLSPRPYRSALEELLKVLRSIKSKSSAVLSPAKVTDKRDPQSYTKQARKNMREKQLRNKKETQANETLADMQWRAMFPRAGSYRGSMEKSALRLARLEAMQSEAESDVEFVSTPLLLAHKKSESNPLILKGNPQEGETKGRESTQEK
mgnify:CR=1 FL=1